MAWQAATGVLAAISDIAKIIAMKQGMGAPPGLTGNVLGPGAFSRPGQFLVEDEETRRRKLLRAMKDLDQDLEVEEEEMAWPRPSEGTPEGGNWYYSYPPILEGFGHLYRALFGEPKRTSAQQQINWPYMTSWR